MRFSRDLAALLLFTSTVACGSTANEGSPGAADGGRDAQGADARASDASPDSHGPAASCDGGLCIEHLVVIVQENHTFDSQFGGYCTAAPGSNPTCNDGPACCEAMPATDPMGTKPTVLTDAENASFNPNHEQACELSEIDDGKMDMFATAGLLCGDPRNVAIADPTIVKPYWTLAGAGAIADRYFQPIAGQSASNDMYLARAAYVFTDNTDVPKGAVGVPCVHPKDTTAQFTDQTIGDLLTAAKVPWTWFSDGYDAMVAAMGQCPPRPADCPSSSQASPCAFDPEDVPFDYYASTRDNPSTLKDVSALDAALQSGSGLPAVSFVKPIGYRSEHPGNSVTESAGIGWVDALVGRIEASAYGASTLVLVTYDEGGGYYDHVAPPPASTVDGKPYGTRVPLIAVGPFARKNYVSHVTMEHSSIVKFIEWNWLGQKTGQLGTRDAVVNNIGSLLDPAKTGVTVPAN
jgi:phospholipase C